MLSGKAARDDEDSESKAWRWAAAEYPDKAYTAHRLASPPDRPEDVFEIGYKSEGGTFYVIGHGETWTEALRVAAEKRRRGDFSYTRPASN